MFYSTLNIVSGSNALCSVQKSEGRGDLVPPDSFGYAGVTVTDGSSKPLTPIKDLTSTSFQMATVSVVASVLIRINISVGSSDCHWKRILTFQDKPKFFNLTAAGSLRFQSWNLIHLASIQFLVSIFSWCLDLFSSQLHFSCDTTKKHLLQSAL